MNKEGSFTPIFIAMILSLVLAGLWNSVPVIGESVHAVLDPTAGKILNWNITYGMLIIVAIIAFITTLVQKYATDQETMREMKKEQKELQEEMKKYKEHPEKLMELQKKQFEFMPKMMKLSMRPLVYTAIPFVLFFRWFNDYFAMPALEGFRFFGFLSWFWFYLIFAIIFGSIFRKVLKVV